MNNCQVHNSIIYSELECIIIKEAYTKFISLLSDLEKIPYSQNLIKGFTK